MKISDVRTIGLRNASVDGGWPDNRIQPEDNLHTLVEVESDEGLVGLGSCFTSKGLIDGAIKLLKPMLVGMPDDEPDRVSETLRQKCFWQGRGGAVEHAISGVDIALWDLVGRRYGVSTSKLLGGRYREKIRPYASILFDEPERLAENLRSVVSRGFRAIKMGWRPFG
ncbi:MAG: mandelate racemase/muconate lactonizing enzyme family protein, partial [Planctomycetia bacterium]